MDDHDTSYRLLFSHPQVVRDLLLGFMPAGWAQALDIDTLERVSNSYVTDDLRSRCDDVIWRVRWGEDWIYVYLLLEFQSSVDRFMAVRIMGYVALLYQDLIRSGQLEEGRTLSPVLPVVLYNGTPRWWAPLDIAALIHPGPTALSAWRPAMQYLLLDEGAFDEACLPGERNLVGALFRLENSRTPEDFRRVLRHLIDWLGTPEQADLRRSLTVWLRRVLLPRRLPHSTLPEIRDLQEVETMLSERVKEWTADWKQQGLEQGLEQGRQEGRRQGLQEGRREEARTFMLAVIERRFGEVPPWVSEHIEGAEAARLHDWALALLDAVSLEQVFSAAR